jgi:MFS family permease
MSAPAAKASASQLILGYFRDFKVLKETRPEYWGIQVINFLDNMTYFGILNVVSIFLSKDLGLDDKQAGYTITVFTSSVSLLLFVAGAATDWLGIRRSLYAVQGMSLVLRGAMVAVGLMPSLPHRGILAGIILFLMAPAMAGLQTVFQSATNRYTTRRSRGAGFNLWYLFMNVGAAAGGFSMDVVGQYLHLSYVHIFTLGVATAALSLVTARLMVHSEEQLVDPTQPKEEQEKEAKVARKNPLQNWREMAQHAAFWRLLVLVGLIVGVRAVYVYVYILMPKYWMRTIGPDAKIGILETINPIGIVVGIILFIPFANRFPVFKMLVYGAMISSLSLVPFAVPWTAYGMGIGQAHYLMAILSMVLLTIGEVIWSPKLYEYTAAIAPKGQEGAYLGISLLPWFVAKTIVSALSGHLLLRWAPETVAVGGAPMPLQQAMVEGRLDYWHRPESMWLVLGGYALLSCIIAAFLEKWLTQGAAAKPAAA